MSAQDLVSQGAGRLRGGSYRWFKAPDPQHTSNMYRLARGCRGTMLSTGTGSGCTQRPVPLSRGEVGGGSQGAGGAQTEPSVPPLLSAGWVSWVCGKAGGEPTDLSVPPLLSAGWVSWIGGAAQKGARCIPPTCTASRGDVGGPCWAKAPAQDVPNDLYRYRAGRSGGDHREQGVRRPEKGERGIQGKERV